MDKVCYYYVLLFFTKVFYELAKEGSFISSWNTPNRRCFYETVFYVQSQRRPL